MMIHKITPSVDYNLWLKRLVTQLNQNSIKVPKVVNLNQQIKKRLLKLWGLV